MRRFRKRTMSVVAALGLSAVLVPLLGVSPAGAAPGAQPAPTVTPNPVPLNTSQFSLSNGTCDGTGGDGWRVETFIVDAAADVSTILFDQGFPPNSIGDDRDATGDGVVRSPLWKGNGPGTTYNPFGSPAGLINPTDLSAFDFSDPGWNLVDGSYEIGFVCKAGTGTAAPEQWWVQTVTIDTTPGGGSNFMTVGTAAPAPSIVSVTPASGQLTIDFAGIGADNWTAQASTVSGDFSAGNLVGTSTTATVDTQNITISGLTNGTPYFVRVLANKAGFAPVPSTQSGPHSPGANGGAVQNLAVTATGTDAVAGPPQDPFVDVDWNAPATVAGSGCTVSGYTVAASTISGPVGTPAQPDPDYSGTKSNSARITGVPVDTQISVTVTPTFNVGCSGTAASVTTIINTGNVVIQDIDVTRPIGALVLTQVCGSNGALPGEGNDASGTPFPTNFNPAGPDTPGDGANNLSVPVLGFDRNDGLPPVAANNSSSVGDPYYVTGAGHAPKLHVDPPSGTPTDQPGSDNDPAYGAGEYPYPTDGNGGADPAVETHCGLDLDVADFVTQGLGAGQYFSADAAMNQVTIVDTRNVDQGWNVSGAMTNFVATSEQDDGTGTGALDFFSGDFLGWTPVVTEDTPAFDDDADPGSLPYNMAVTAGPRVAPNTDLGLGDGSKELLASAAPGSGLGTAILDARIKLLIPVTADAGLYEGSLTFSVL